MTNQLPAFLQNYQSRGLIERATQGMGSAMPPHVSIRGNQFTLIDAAGEKTNWQGPLDCCLFDISDVMCKKYFKADWEPGSNDPPACWSANGVAPSIEAMEPQSPTCASCEWNVRGSETSKLSGKPIKACRDEKWLALLIPSMPGMVFQLVLSPGSFKNWAAYNKVFEAQKFGWDVAITRIAFAPQVNGVLTFQPIGMVDEATYTACQKALAGKVTDALVGRNDRPRGLPAPAAVMQIAPQASAHQPAVGQVAVQAPTTTRFPPEAPQVEAPKRTRGRPKATEAAPQPAQTAQRQPGPVQEPQLAPFRPQPAPAASNGPAFGIGEAVPPNPELAATLASLGFPQ